MQCLVPGRLGNEINLGHAPQDHGGITMQARPTVGIISGGTVLAWLIYKVITWFGDAQAANDMIDIVRGFDINWGLPLLWIVCLGFCGLVWSLWPWATRIYSEWTYEPPRDWDATAEEAINYIAYATHVSRTLPKNQRLEMAAETFIDAAKSGRIKCIGRRPDTATAIPIKKHVWRDYKPSWRVRQAQYRDEELHTFMLIKDKGEPLYEGIMVDRDEIEKTWLRNQYGGQV